MNKHDASYRLLFSNPAIVQGLFNGIINAPWLNMLDWSKLAPIPTDYISDKLRQRHGDIVWRLPRLDGHDVYLLLMIEHQSTIDFYMALRILTYQGLLYESLLAQKLVKPRHPLPVTVPVVIYSGIPRWTAPTNVIDLINTTSSELRPYSPQMQYLLVDEGALLDSGELPEDNLATLLFRLEHNHGIQDVERLIQKVYNYTKENTMLRRAFTSWTRHVLLPRALPDINLPQVNDLLEIKDMLNEHSRSWTHQWKMEGLAEGRQEGLKEGQVSMLHNLLTRKFGPLPAEIQQRLNTATPDQLEAWSLNLLEAEQLSNVFTHQ